MKADLTFLRSFTSGQPDKMKKYINMFLQVCPASLQTLNTHVEALDYNGIRGTVHALKPQLTYMGLSEAESLAKEIENDAGNQSNVTMLPQKVQLFISLCEAGINDLKTEMSAL